MKRGNFRATLESTGKDAHGIASSLGHLADAAKRSHDYPSARTLYEESLAMFIESGSKWHTANVLAELAKLSCEQGDFGSARSLYQESMVIFGELGVSEALLDCLRD